MASTPSLGLPYERATGHPSPLVQVQGQIRTSTGFTLVGRNKLPPSIFGQAWREAPTRRGADAGAAAQDAPADRLLAHLHTLVGAKETLPRLTELARAIGDAPRAGWRDARRTRQLLDDLRERGEIEVHDASAQQVTGTMAVRLVKTGAVLRQYRAPAGVFA